MFRSRDTQRIFLACGIIVAAGVAAYSNTLHAPFVFDGLTLERRFATTTLSADPTTWFGVYPRTIGFFTFDLQNTLHGPWLPGFHAANIAIHIIAALFLFAAVLVTCRGPRQPADIRRDAVGIALVAALFFELHPLQTQSVTYVYQRFESLMGMWFLAALAAFAWAVRDDAAPRGRWAWFVAAWAAILLSIGTKEVGAVAPAVLLWYDRVFASRSWQELLTRRWWFYAPALVLFAGAAAYLYAFREHYADGGIFDTQRMSPLTYAISQPEVICRYLRLAIWPRGLCLDWYWKPADTLWRIVPPLLAISALLAFVGWSIVRLPVVGFLLGSFFLILAPTSSIAPIIDLAFEHRMYLPLAPLAVLAVLAGREALRRVPQRLFDLTLPPAAGLVPAAIIAIALGVTTYLRNEVYRSGLSLWRDIVAKSPANPRALATLAWHLELELGDTARAIELNRKALQIDPRIATAHRGLAIMFHGTDRAAATYHARQAVRLERSAENLSNLGIVIAQELPEEAEALFRAALELDPRFRSARLNLAKLLTLTDRAAEAEALLRGD